MAAKGRAPVISLLSSDEEEEEVELPAPRKASTSVLKENVEPKRSTSRELPKNKPPKPTSITSTKATEKPKPLKTSSSSLSSNVQKPVKKAADPITISSSPPASPPPPRQQSHYATYTKSYPGIFGGLSSDPILSQSSPVTKPTQLIVQPPEPTVKSKTALEELLGDSSEDGLSDNDRASPERSRKVDTKGKGRAASPVFSEDFQERLRQLYPENEPETKRRKLDLQISSASSSPEPIPASTAPGRKSKLTEAEKAARAAERDAARAAKAAEREAQKEQKKVERERKALQRSESQAMSSANKLKCSHVETTGQMIVNISSDLYASPTGVKLQALLSGINVESHAPFDSPVPKIIKWRRVVTAEWDSKEDLFIPVPRKIQDENHVLAVIEAKEFVDLANAPDELDIFIAKIKTEYPTCKPIVLIEGLTKLINKSKSSQSRAYAAQVRNRMREDGGRETVRVDKAAQTVDEDNIEDALLKLQVVHGCLLCHTQDGTYTAESIGYYTQHISQIPQKHRAYLVNKSVGFCLEAGQVQSGKNVEDTYNKMLQTVHMSTAGIAGAIQSEYPSIQKLFNAFMDEGEDLLKDIRIVKTGGGRALGPAVSRRFARILTGTDETDLELA
ncbi:hypothetical protein TWF481_006898 [Arthrobotrys musiformis]|uniref:ERCC4 domain-containing protein n=1 Tax=Arthrobotrys musiformis TaxID=47236 RepID=A0AAV9WAV2_9PEZI